VIIIYRGDNILRQITARRAAECIGETTVFATKSKQFKYKEICKQEEDAVLFFYKIFFR
jgi:hypothetical protein